MSNMRKLGSAKREKTQTQISEDSGNVTMPKLSINMHTPQGGGEKDDSHYSTNSTMGARYGRPLSGACSPFKSGAPVSAAFMPPVSF